MKARANPKPSPALNVRGAFIQRTDLSNANLRGADLSLVDATGAAFRNSDFSGARLTGAILRGADLTGATNLTIEQLSKAVIDNTALLPEYIDRTLLKFADDNQRNCFD